MSDAVVRSTSQLVLDWISPPDWVEAAACGDDPDPDRWFRKEDAAEALAMCSWCLVREDCATWALKNSIPFGIWGSLTEDERRERKPRPARPRPGFTRGQAPAA